jgi:hypothetical protein
MGVRLTISLQSIPEANRPGNEKGSKTGCFSQFPA